MLTRTDFLEKNTLVIKKIELPMWDDFVFIKELTASERDKFESSIVGRNGKKKDLTNIRARMVAISACDEGGTLIFDDSDVYELGNKSAAALDLIYDASMKLSGLDKETKTDKTEELEKN